MDAISYSYADKQAKRIKKFNENPDSASGILTQPSIIQSGETVTIPSGRTAIMANTVIDGTINLDGTIFIPSGATTDDIDAQLALKAPLENPVFTSAISTQGVNYKSTPVSVTSWSYSGTTITLNVTSHTYLAGEHIETYGLTSTTNAPNGAFLVTSVTTGTIVFTAYAAPTGTAGVSTARVKGITTLNGKIISEDIGINQSWQLVTRLSNTNYSNTSNRMIKMVVYGNSSVAATQINAIITPIGSTTAITIPIDSTTSSGYGGFNFSIPAGCTYKIAPLSGTFTVATWYEFK